MSPETIAFTLNGQLTRLNIEPDTPLLWVLRDELAMNGTKFGCGRGLCGACTVHINGRARRSCTMPIDFAFSKWRIASYGFRMRRERVPSKYRTSVTRPSRSRPSGGRAGCLRRRS